MNYIIIQYINKIKTRRSPATKKFPLISVLWINNSYINLWTYEKPKVKKSLFFNAMGVFS